MDLLKDNVARLVRFQKESGLSDRAMMTRFSDQQGRPLLGSVKTWRERLVPGQFEELNEEKWAARLQAAVQQIDGGPRSAVFYDKLPLVRYMRPRLATLEATRTDRRCLLMLAPTGVGKTLFARHVVEADPVSRVYVAADPTWRDSLNAMCIGLLAALGHQYPAYLGAASALTALTNRLKEAPKTIIIDEAHDGGDQLMRVLRHLIDHTSARFVYMGYPTEFDRVVQATTGTITEARQFLRRCQKPYADAYRDGTSAEDVAAYLREAASFSGNALEFARSITPILRAQHNLNTLADALPLAAELAEKQGEELTPKLLRESILALGRMQVSEEDES